MREVITLARAGVPWTVAAKLKRHERMAYLIAVAEANGAGHYDWSKGRWVNREG